MDLRPCWLTLRPPPRAVRSATIDRLAGADLILETPARFASTAAGTTLRMLGCTRGGAARPGDTPCLAGDLLPFNERAHTPVGPHSLFVQVPEAGQLMQVGVAYLLDRAVVKVRHQPAGLDVVLSQRGCGTLLRKRSKRAGNNRREFVVQLHG